VAIHSLGLIQGFRNEEAGPGLRKTKNA